MANQSKPETERPVDKLSVLSKFLRALMARRLAVEDPARVTGIDPREDVQNLEEAPRVFEDERKGVQRVRRQPRVGTGQ